VGKGLSGGTLIIIRLAIHGSCRRKHFGWQRLSLWRDQREVFSTAWRVSGSRAPIPRRYAVVEGVGDHGCEYMTRGMVVVLGKTGRQTLRQV